LALMTMPSVAPLGGALADGDPHRELPLVRMALGSTHQRELAVEDLFSGYSETVLGKNDLISKVHVPPRTAGSAEDWPARGAAGNDWAVRSRSAELVLNGMAANARLLRKAAEAAIGDARALVPYERKQLRGHVRRAIRAVPNPAGRP
jgi:aerobic carbon-monoxide dehydrogenase medium subunit